MRLICMIISLFILLPLKLSMAQKSIGTDTRLIVINHPDSTVHARILIARPDIKIDNSKLYFWYAPDCIYANRGGFSGYLLHGDYSVYNKNNRMIAQGAFFRGLKTGIWKRWYANGNLAELIVWEYGLLHGSSYFYNPDGSVIRSDKYKSGKLIQKQSTPVDSLITKPIENTE
jgi:hypothetical protein